MSCSTHQKKKKTKQANKKIPKQNQKEPTKTPEEISAKDLLIFLVLTKFRFLFAGFGFIFMMFHVNISSKYFLSTPKLLKIINKM